MIVKDMGEETRLTRGQQRLCLDITRKLNELPASVVFRRPVDPREFPDYPKKIKKPRDLGTIYQKLQAGEYGSVTQWEEDIKTVWSNAEVYNAKDPPFVWLAQHMRARFQHLKKPLDIYSLSGWAKHIYKLRERMDELLRTCPAGLQRIVGKSLDGSVPGPAVFSAEDIDRLMKASKIVNKPKDFEHILSILRKNDPPLDLEGDSVVVDVNSLSVPVLQEISGYYRDQMIEDALAPTET